MFPTRKRIVLLHLSGQVIRATANHPFFVTGQGWTDATDLQPGDKLCTHDDTTMAIDAITDTGEQAMVCQMDAALPQFPCTGLWPAGTMIETVDGPKPIDEIKPGDRIVVRNPLDPERN